MPDSNTHSSEDADKKEHAPSNLGFDPQALRDKYREERDKRLRTDGNDQYLEVKEQFSNYLDDPYIEPGFSREALHDEVEVMIIGGGFGGLLAGARLREAGIEDIRIIEKGGDFGGTWYWNRYPGAACDVESYVYLPLLEETNYIPTEKYVRAPEILLHCGAIAKKYDLYRDVCFQTEVTEMRWNDSDARWIITTSRGDRIRARYVAMSNGPLHRPKLPGIPGVESFRGHTFHTSRWDYAYTGGDSNGNLTGLRDKRVGIIGTGATAVQCIPHLAESAAQVFVFQRTPSSIDVRDNRPTDANWTAALEAGWHQDRMDNFNTLTSGGYAEEDLVKDGWTDIIRNLLLMVRTDQNADLSPAGLAKTMELADFQKMEKIRARVDAIVADGATAEALKPYYRQFCKRPCFHDDYLAAFNRPNVTLVDTNGRGVEAITERGVIVDGVEYELDCLIYATGFEVGTSYTRRSGFEIYGRNGLSLSDKWADGVATMHGMHSRGFPNCYIMGSVQSGFSVNYPHALNEQSKHIAHIIAHGIEHGLRTMEVSVEAEAEWVNTIIEKSRQAQDFLESCTPGYYNNEGQPGKRKGQDGFYGGGSIEFFQILQDWRDNGGLRGLDMA